MKLFLFSFLIWIGFPFAGYVIGGMSCVLWRYIQEIWFDHYVDEFLCVIFLMGGAVLGFACVIPIQVVLIRWNRDRKQ